MFCVSPVYKDLIPDCFLSKKVAMIIMIMLIFKLFFVLCIVLQNVHVLHGVRALIAPQPIAELSEETTFRYDPYIPKDQWKNSQWKISLPNHQPALQPIEQGMSAQELKRKK